MRLLIVDDEPLSRDALKNAVGVRKDVESLDSAADAVEALEMLEKESHHVLLLDIQMPELSGIELADRLNKRRGAIPAIIFVTAHEQHAIAAFARNAVDYILKLSPGRRASTPLRIKGGKEYTVSRTYKSNLKSLAKSWIGTENFTAE